MFLYRFVPVLFLRSSVFQASCLSICFEFLPTPCLRPIFSVPSPYLLRYSFLVLDRRWMVGNMYTTRFLKGLLAGPRSGKCKVIRKHPHPPTCRDAACHIPIPAACRPKVYLFVCLVYPFAEGDAARRVSTSGVRLPLRVGREKTKSLQIDGYGTGLAKAGIPSFLLPLNLSF